MPIQKNRKLLYRILNKPNEVIRKIAFKKLFREEFIGTDFRIVRIKNNSYLKQLNCAGLKNLLEVPILDENTGALKNECKEALTPAKVLTDSK